MLQPILEAENWGPGPYYHYDLIRENTLSDLEERLVIDWGSSTVSWCQKKLDKEIVEILPRGYAKTFLGYENTILVFDELEKIVRNPDVNKQWKMMLSNVYGIYLILDKSDGQQYVGSAYGKEGLWGRWSNYVQTKHGGNKILIDLLNTDPLRYKKFQFSILSVLPHSSLHDQVIQLNKLRREVGFKSFWSEFKLRDIDTVPFHTLLMAAFIVHQPLEGSEPGRFPGNGWPTSAFRQWLPSTAVKVS